MINLSQINHNLNKLRSARSFIIFVIITAKNNPFKFAYDGFILCAFHFLCHFLLFSVARLVVMAVEVIFTM